MIRSRFHRFILWMPFVVALPFSPDTGTARAQDTPPAATTKPTVPKPPFPTLKVALDVTAWSNTERGPLFAIAPEHVTEPKTPAVPTADADARQPLVPPREGFGLNASVVARHFDRRLISIGSLTVLAPLTMSEFNRDLKPANPYHDLSLEDKMRRLEATLSPSQWAQLGGPSGLGASDLSAEQQPIFDALLPDTMRIGRVKTPALGSAPAPNSAAAPPIAILSTTERAAVHIRLDRTAALMLIDTEGSSIDADDSFSSDEAGTQTLELQDDPAKDDSEDFSYLGQSIVLKHTNALKQSDLDLHTSDMEAAISVEGLRTVGDVVRAVRTKLGREIYADGRLARLSVYFSSQAHGVRVGDLLEALCWSLTSTFRKVGPVTGGDDKGAIYLLTNDREGIAVRDGIVWGWLHDAETAQSDLIASLKKNDPSLQHDDVAHFAPNDLLALTPDAEKRLETARQNDTLDSVTLPVSALSDEQRQQFQTLLGLYAKEHKDDEQKPTTPRTDRVGAMTYLGLTLVIPGLGEIRQYSSWSDPRFTAPEDRVKPERLAALRKLYQSGPVAVHNAIVCLAPQTVGEVVKAMETLKPRGIAALWLRVPETPAGRALLTDSIAAGQKRGVAVGAQLSLMEVSPGDLAEPLPSTLEDHNVFGETGPEANARIAAVLSAHPSSEDNQSLRNIDPTSRITPEGEAALPLLMSRIRAVAAIPGLAALACDHAATSGYRWRTSAANTFWPGADFGYSLTNRLVMIRQNGYDPIDFTEQSRGYLTEFAMLLPFFNSSYEEGESDDEDATPALPGAPGAGDAPKGPPPPPTPAELWRTFRVQQQTHLLNSLSADLAAAHPKLALFLTPNANLDYYERRDRPTDPLWAEPVLNPRGIKTVTPTLTVTSALTAGKLYRTIPFRADTLETLQHTLGAPATAFTAPQLLAANIARQMRSTRTAAKAAGTNPPILDLSAMPIADAVPLLEAALLPVAGAAH